MIDLRDRSQLLIELLVADILALPGRGPLARRSWPPARPQLQQPAVPEAASAAAPAPGEERGRR